ncbi:AAC(3) family N-acetyltransferase [Natrialbaceae archaeon A-CW1-1]
MDRITRARLSYRQIHRIGSQAINKVSPIPKSATVSEVREAELDAILSNFENDTIFVHAGLSDIRSAFGKNPYKFLLNKLSENFQNVLAPGFTSTYRRSGVYHKKFSRPEHGMFNQLFLSDADYRTDDAIHSILVKGEYRFSDCDHHDTFGESSCWNKLDRENIPHLNIGTGRLRCFPLHYIENKYDLPYNEVTEYEGVIYYSESEYKRISQTSYDYSQKVRWNRKKIKSYLEKEGALKDHSVNGLRIYSFYTRDTREALLPQIDNDPYYLVV